MIIVTLGGEVAGGAEVAALADHDRFVVDCATRVEPGGEPVAVHYERWRDGRCTGTAECSWDDGAGRGAVASWMDSTVSESARQQVCIVGPERDLLLASAILTALAGDHCLIFEQAEYHATVLRLENGAYACAVVESSAVAEWNRRHPFPAELVDPTDPGALVAFVQRSDDMAAAATAPERGDVLLVSYFGVPSTPVSTKRLGYWHDEIERLSEAAGHRLTPWWLSATRRSQGLDRCLHIPDPGDDAFDPSAPSTMNGMRDLKLSELGGAWELAVRRAVREWPGRFDTVVISVGPFGYLGLAEFFAQEWGARVVIDFRDPLAGDGRRPYSIEQRVWLAEFERDQVRHADAVISVNQTCLERIAPDVTVDRHTVANGFDERINVQLSTPDRSVHRIVYSGTIFSNLPLDRFIDGMDPSRFELVHYGRDNSVQGLIGVQPGTVAGGFLSDAAELTRAVADSDLGLVRVSGEPTTQTTKVFDYLGAGIEVLIVTDGVPRTGGLHELTEGTPGVHWVRNDVADIANFLDGYEPRRPDRGDVAHLSREAQTRRLIDVIEQRRQPELRRPSPTPSPVPAGPRSDAEEVLALRKRVDSLERALARVTGGLNDLDHRTFMLRLDRQLRSAGRRVRRKLQARLPQRFAGAAAGAGSSARAVRKRRSGPGLDFSSPGDSPRVLIVASAYPVGGGTYGGQPIARRVRHYRNDGYETVVFVPTTAKESRDVIDDDGTRIIVARSEEFGAIAGQVRPDALAVHSPVPETWPDIEPLSERVPTVTWFHGFESRDWRLLSFDYTAEEIERLGPRLDAVMVARRRLLEGIFASDTIETVFVSEYMRTVAESFVGVPSRNGHVIHNVIDTDLFAYRARDRDERFRISSVRSFAKRNYGTDMIAPFVRELQTHPLFDRVELSVVGTGKFFAADVASIADLPNVSVAEQVLTAQQLSSHLDGHGISLLPTRWDSQGMLMGESMATGAVPVTNAVTAIPEFADDTVGVLAPADDHRALAAGVAEMLDDPDVFMDRSAAARRRVVEQCGPAATTGRELAIFDRLLR